MSSRLKVTALGLFTLACAGVATAAEPSCSMSVKGMEGGIFSRLEMTVYLKNSGTVPTFADLDSMPYITLVGYEAPWGNVVLSEELIRDAEFWAKVSGLMDAVDLAWLEDFLTGIQGNGIPGPNPGPGSSNGSGMASDSEELACSEGANAVQSSTGSRIQYGGMGWVWLAESGLVFNR